MPIRALAALLLGLFFSNPSSAEWKREWLVPGGPFRGIHGLVVGPDGMLYVGSVMGQTIHRVDPRDVLAEAHRDDEPMYDDDSSPAGHTVIARVLRESLAGATREEAAP